MTAAFLSVSGGLQDAYTYLYRGKVFANAQTGNIVLLSQCLGDRDWLRALHYLVPLTAFALGIAAAQGIRGQFSRSRRIHWRQLVLLVEILLLLLVGLLPQGLNLLANALVSFACAMQVQSFRKVSGCAFASTMCIGNIRSGMESLCVFLWTRRREELRRAARYWGIIFLFALGAAAGGRLITLLGARAIWVSCGLLLVGLCLMFIHEDVEENPRVRRDGAAILADLQDIGQELGDIGRRI